MTSLPMLVGAAFALLTAALIMLWIARRSPLWMVPGAASLALGFAAALIDLRGLLALTLFAGLCAWARRPMPRVMKVLAHALVLIGAGALFLHVIPGFANPRLVTGALLAPDSLPYTKYLNFDKGMAGLFLLGLYARERTAGDEGWHHLPAFAWRFAITVAATMIVSVALGYVHWDPKLPPFWLGWTYSMVFLTALPEEAMFRGVALTALARWMAQSRYAERADGAALFGAALLFGLAHGAGGPVYMLVATIAGLGYGWIYLSTRSLAAAIAAHAGLNAVHFLFFSYPALR